MSTPARLSALTIGALASCLLAACSSSSGGHPAAASLPGQLASLATSTTTAGSVPSSSAASSLAGSLSQMSMRIVNLFAPKGAAGPALDIYDVQLTGQQATPVATNVAYGSASAYFTPHLPAHFVGQPIVTLSALPAGEDPVTDKADAQEIGGAQDDGSHPQITWVLTADTGDSIGTSPLAGLSFSQRVEKGDNNGSKAPVAPAPASGQGEILADTTAVQDQTHLLYLLIDSSCAPPINGDPNTKGLPEIFAASSSTITSSYAIFPTVPGSHQVSVVANAGGTEPTCAQLTAKQGTASVDVAAGQQIEVYIYGTSATDLHLAVAPITQ